MVPYYYRGLPWRGLDKNDGQYRIYRVRSSNLIRDNKGILLNTLIKSKLVRLAWKLGVSNLDGFNIHDAWSFNMTYNEGYQCYIKEWSDIKKTDIISHIWNHLLDMENISYI